MVLDHSQLENAIALAVTSHRGQTTLDGLPYILHPLRVMLSFTDSEDDAPRIVAVLHDVVEDCGITMSALHQIFPCPVVDAILALSRQKGEEYTDYIGRVATNPLARRVKVADLHDNLDPKRLSTAKLANGQFRKYLDALEYLRCAPEKL